MKKIFTLLLVFLSFMAAKAQDWNFSGTDFASSLGTLSASTTINGLTIYASAAKSVVLEASAVTVDGTDYTVRAKMGGAGEITSGTPTARVLSFSVTGPSTITIVGVSSGVDRWLGILTSTGDSIGKFPAGATAAKASYTYTKNESATIWIYSLSGGINLYQVKCEAGPSVNLITANATLVKTAFYNLSGRLVSNRQNALAKGIYIQKSYYSNGAVVNTKFVKDFE
jgi:hypothetical protein